MGKEEISPIDIQILDYCMKHTVRSSNTALPTMPQYVDQYVLDNFYCLCQNITKITLRTDLILFGIQNDNTIPTDRSNIFRPILFDLCPHLVNVVYTFGVNAGFLVNLPNLLSLLKECTLPLSFKEIKIMENKLIWHERSWANGEMNWMQKMMQNVPSIVELF